MPEVPGAGGGVGSVTAGNSTIVLGGTPTNPTVARAALTGDVTAAAGSNATVLVATANVKAIIEAYAGTVTSVAATDSSIVVAGTPTVAPTIQRAALTGDITAAAGSNATALKATGPGATGPIGSTTTTPVVTIDAQGRVTALTSATIAGGSSLTSSSGVISSNVALPASTITPIFSTASLAAGTWLVSYSINLACSTAALAGCDVGLVAGTATVTFPGPSSTETPKVGTGAGSFASLCSLTQTVIAVITVAGTLTLQVGNADVTNAGTVYHQGTQYSFPSTTGYAAVKIA